MVDLGGIVVSTVRLVCITQKYVRGGGLGFCEWEGPEPCVGVSVARQDDEIVMVDVDHLGIKCSIAAVVTKLSNGDERIG